jgi:prevent-host-death family protein
MKERTVGVRELKANLSACLRRVKSGDTIVISERGKPIGRIYPIEMPLEDRLLEGVHARHWSWNGRKWQPVEHGVKARGKVLVSDLLLEDRV